MIEWPAKAGVLIERGEAIAEDFGEA